MKGKSLSIGECFIDVSDPRMTNKTKHQMLDMIVITICAVISGANSWVEVEEYGHAKRDWLNTLLELPNGMPSHDTFGRLFAMLDTEELERSFQRWVHSVVEVMEGGIHIDGKQIRRSYDKAPDKSAVRLVSAWASLAGLTRQYFPKQSDLRKISQHRLDEVMHKLNHRPRKTLDFQTPYELFFLDHHCCT